MPCIIDADGKLCLNDELFKIEMESHGDGDIHLKLLKEKIILTWKEMGKE